MPADDRRPAGGNRTGGPRPIGCEHTTRAQRTDTPPRRSGPSGLTWYGAPLPAAILDPDAAARLAVAAGVRPIAARRRPDLGKRRRRIARAALHAAATRRDWATLSSDARLIYALSLLLADAAGRVGLADTAAALADPDAVACALDLIDKATP